MSEAAAPRSPVIQRSLEVIDQIERESKQLLQEIHSSLSASPAELAYLAKLGEEAMRALQQHLQEFWKAVEKATSQLLGDPERLREVAESWINGIAVPLGDTAGNITFTGSDKEGLSSAYYWSGPAREKYVAAVETQNKKLEALNKIPTEVADILRTFADTIEQIWTALLGALVSTLFSIAGARFGMASGDMAAILVGMIAGKVAEIAAKIGAVIIIIQQGQAYLNAVMNKSEKLSELLDQEVKVNQPWSVVKPEIAGR